MFGIIDPLTGFSPEEEKDFEEFISKLFNVDFSFAKDLYLVKEGNIIHKCKQAYDHYIKIGDNFYKKENIIIRRQFLVDEKDYDTLLLLPLNNRNINDIDEKEKTIHISERTSEDINQEWDKAINLSLEWALFKGAKHPERIEEYKKKIQNKITNLKREERKLQGRINAENQKLEMLSDLQTSVSQEEDKSL